MSDNTEDQQEMVTQFSDVTGVTPERAKFFLESANWTLQLALGNFYEQDDNNPLDNVLTDDEEPTGVAAGSSTAANEMAAAEAAAFFGRAAAQAKPKKTKSQPTSGPRIATIHNMSKSSSEDEEEQGQAFYTGTERSGQQILGPPKRNPIKDYVSEIFRSAQENGAEMVEPQPTASGSSSGPSPFVGTGYRLGQTNDDHVTLPEQLSRPSRPTNIEPVVLKLWRQGFSINDGELRSYEEQSNKEFLESIMKGEIPAELRQQGGLMVHVDLEDHRHEDYQRVAAKVKPFAGKGHTLGSPAPNVVSAGAAPSMPTLAGGASVPVADPNTNLVDAQKSADEQLAVNPAEPTTMIQVRLADGSRLSARFNHTHTISDIRNYITIARPQYAAQNFALLNSYPPKELSNDSETISTAGLLNAALLQRLK